MAKKQEEPKRPEWKAPEGNHSSLTRQILALKSRVPCGDVEKARLDAEIVRLDDIWFAHYGAPK